MDRFIYLQEQEINELFGNHPGEGKQIIGIAYALDDNTVFHASIKGLSGYHADQLPCYFYAFNSHTELANAVPELNGKLSQEQDALLVAISIVSGESKIQGFFKSRNDLFKCEIRFIPVKSDLYSRSKGLLEVECLSKKHVAIVGLGSGGSPLAVELAKAGVGSFTLIDYDRLELANVARHICGINDLGRYKTFAVRDAIWQKNPHTSIKTYEIDVNKEMATCEKAVSNADLILCASDNDKSRFYLNELSLKYKIPGIFGRALTRAIGGDILRVRPFQGPCYNCLYSQNLRADGGDDEEISQSDQAKKLLPDYTSTQELQAIIQVGLASDIAPISNMMVKLSLVELSRGIDTGIASLEEDLVSDFYIWANRRENVYENWSKLEYNFNKPSILRWYGAKVKRDENCMACGKR